MVTAVKLDIEDGAECFSKQDSETVMNYLMKRTSWYSLEYILYIDCIPFLESKYFEKLFEKLLTIHFALKQKNGQQDLFFQALYNTAAMFYYQSDYERALITLTQLQMHGLPDDHFYIRIQAELLRRRCQVKLKNCNSDQDELEQLIHVLTIISPAFGKKWEEEFSHRWESWHLQIIWRFPFWKAEELLPPTASRSFINAAVSCKMQVRRYRKEMSRC